MFRLLSARVAAAVLVGLAAGAGVGLALAAAVDGSTQKAAALDRLASVATTDSSTAPAPAPAAAPHPIPGQMLGTDVPVPIAPSILQVRNGWLVSDGKTLVAVYAGAAGNDRAVGRVVIVRQNLVAGKQTVRTIDAGSTGVLTIAVAPLGRAVETSAQTGALTLRTSAGRLLTLDLSTGTISHDAHGRPLP